MAFAGHPILDEIKTGFKLRPTKTVDKSKPVFLAEGESDAEISVTKRLNASNGTDEVDSIPKLTASTTPRASPKPSPAVSPVAPVVITPGVVPPPPPPPPGSLGGAPPPPPPPPPGGIPPPPPPPMGVAPPPPAPVVKKPITNPKLLNLGGKAVATDEDRGELLKSIQGGFKLRKTVTNDKSGLHVDDELKSKSVKMVTPTAPPPELLAPPKTRSQLSPRGLDSSEDERYLTADDRSASCTPEPEEKPRQFKWACPSEKKEVLKSDFVFEEKNLHITADDLKEEIPKGLAAAKIAKWLQAENTDGAATLPRPSFRASPSPLRGNSPFKEVNNNNSGSMDTLKPKAPSKWAVVETGGLRRPGQGNVPLDKSRETTPQPMRERSCSALDRPVREPVDRAMTASPIERRRSSARAEVPLTVKTDFPSPTSSSDSKQISPLSSASTKATSPASTKPTSSPSSTKPTSSPASTKAAATPSPAKTASSATKPAASPATKASSKPSPISTKNTTPLTIDTDFSSIATSKKSPKKGSMKKKSTATTTKPEIKETPPTPSHKTNGSAYTYKRTERPASPPEPAASLPSPVSSMSSASVPSPSSISPGSTSPDSAPRRRVVNPNFDKVKEKFSGSGSATPSPTPSRPLLKTTNSVRDSPFHSKTNTPSPRGSVSSTKDEAAAVKKAVKEAAASKQKQRVINVPISAPWHTPRESYSSFDYSPRSPRDYTTSLSRDYSRDYTSPRDYSSPRDHYTTSTREYSPRDYSSRDYYPQSEPTDWRPPRDSGDSNRRTRYDPDSYKYSSIHPDDLRRNYRFNIDLSADSPLSLSRR